MADVARGANQAVRAIEAAKQTPLETAKQIAATMCRQPKEAQWLGVRMENFLRVHGRKIASVTAASVCDYLEALMRNGQVEWQVKQALDAIGLLMHYGYQRVDLAIPALREAWGLRLNQRAGISVPEVSANAAEGQSPVTVRLRRVLRVASCSLRRQDGEGALAGEHGATAVWGSIRAASSMVCWSGIVVRHLSPHIFRQPADESRQSWRKM